MNLSKQPYKGTRDFYPEDKRVQKYIFGKIRETIEKYGYQEYDAPLLEPFELYAAKSGEEIVNEQLYSFEDKGGRKMAIRPEMTPSVSRMVAARRQELAYPLRWYSIPNLWRYERPQRGRLREHWQLNVDLFGVEGIEGDAEIIQVADSILKGLGAKPEMYEIKINSRIATQEALNTCGLNAAEQLVASKIIDKQSKLSDDEFKQALTQAITDQKAQKVLDYLSDNSPPANIQKLLGLLDSCGVTSVVYDRSVVRGLDYYTDIVFEVYDNNPDNNRSMFGGGRYDGLVAMFGVESVPTVGFGMGDVTLQNFLESNKLLPELESETEATAILIGDVYEQAQALLNQLREKGVKIAVDSTSRKLDAKIKAADKAGAKYAIFIGDSELASGKLKLKNLQSGEESVVSPDEIVARLQAR